MTARRDADSHAREPDALRSRRRRSAAWCSSAAPARTAPTAVVAAVQMVQDERAARAQAAVDCQRAAGGELRAGGRASRCRAGSRFRRPTSSSTVGRDAATPSRPSARRVAPYETVRAPTARSRRSQKLMTAPRGRSPLHEALIARVTRPPLAVARLAGRAISRNAGDQLHPGARVGADAAPRPAITERRVAARESLASRPAVDRGREAACSAIACS